MSVVRRKKASVSKRKTAPPAKKKRYKVISLRPVSRHFTKGYVKAGTPTFFNAPAGKVQKPVVKKKIYNALNLEMKEKERLYIKFSRKGKKK